jgi:hypothetical protein
MPSGVTPPTESRSGPIIRRPTTSRGDECRCAVPHRAAAGIGGRGPEGRARALSFGEVGEPGACLERERRFLSFYFSYFFHVRIRELGHVVGGQAAQAFSFFLFFLFLSCSNQGAQSRCRWTSGSGVFFLSVFLISFMFESELGHVVGGQAAQAFSFFLFFLFLSYSNQGAQSRCRWTSGCPSTVMLLGAGD